MNDLKKLSNISKIEIEIDKILSGSNSSLVDNLNFLESVERSVRERIIKLMIAMSKR